MPFELSWCLDASDILSHALMILQPEHRKVSPEVQRSYTFHCTVRILRQTDLGVDKLIIFLQLQPAFKGRRPNSKLLCYPKFHLHAILGLCHSGSREKRSWIMALLSLTKQAKSHTSARGWYGICQEDCQQVPTVDYCRGWDYLKLVAWVGRKSYLQEPGSKNMKTAQSWPLFAAYSIHGISRKSTHGLLQVIKAELLSSIVSCMCCLTCIIAANTNFCHVCHKLPIDAPSFSEQQQIWQCDASAVWYI